MEGLKPSDTARLSSCLDKAGRVTVVSHTHPDGDAVGSSAALFHFLAQARGKDAMVILPDPPSDTLTFLCAGDNTIIANAEPQKAKDRIAESDLIILIDANTFQRTEQLEAPLRASTAVKVLIDHHVEPDSDAFSLVFSKQDISSACELLFWILMEMPEIKADAARLPAATATAIMAGMTTDTNNFANSVFPTTLQMASKLLAAGVDRDALLESLYNCYRENRVRVMGFLQSQCMRITPQGAAYMIAFKDILDRFDVHEGETEGLVNVPLAIKKVRISIFLKEAEGHFRVSIRSKEGTSARNLAVKYFHGGGHEKASGGKLFFPEDIPSPAFAAEYIEKVTEEYLK